MRFLEFKPLNEAEGPLKVPQTPADISNIQRALASFRYNVSPTGVHDKQSKQAVAQAQSDLGMKPTGDLDFSIIDAINTAMTAVPGMIDYITTGLTDIGKSVSDLGSKAISSFTSSDKSVKNRSSKSNSPLASDPAFLAKVDSVANELGIHPSVLMRIMKHESQLNPKAKTPNGRAVGLIQFMAPAAESLGTTIREIYNMDAIQQMDLVLRYYKMVGVRPGMNVGDVYMLTFLPKYKNAPDNTILGRKNDPTVIQRKPYITKHNVWDENPAFSHNKTKTYFTKADVIDRINNTYA